ncbi:MAG: NTP transferase domain-containing protein, partial [Planctomycetota bacterium]
MADTDSDTLDLVASLDPAKILNPAAVELGRLSPHQPVLVMLAAGMGTRFGSQPKCIQPLAGTPLARHSLNAFRTLSSAPAVCLVGYRHDEVAPALGYENILIRSDNFTGGTAYAAYEAFSVPDLERLNPLLVVTMGDRVVPATIFRDLLREHQAGGTEAKLTMLTAIYDAPRNQGKGRVIRDEQGTIRAIVEQRDIDRIEDEAERLRLQNQTEGNCPLYAIRAATLRRYLARLDRRNAQQQFYFTDINAAIHRERGEIRSLTVRATDSAYELLCADVTRPADLERLEEVLQRHEVAPVEAAHAAELSQEIISQRSFEQSVSIAAQLEELWESSRTA